MTSGLRAGDSVVLISSGECGVVLSSWFDETTGVRDCYVAFFGQSFPAPNSKPAQVPWVLRYAESSLKKAAGN